MKIIINHRFIIRNPKSALRNQNGIALVMVLVLSAIGLVLMTTLIYMITSGVQVSGMQKRYKTALEAGMGGKDIVLQVLSMKDMDYIAEIRPFVETTLTNAGIPAVIVPSLCSGTAGGVEYNGFQAKLRVSSTSWSPDCNSSIAIDTSDPATYDMTFKLGTSPQYTVYAKIVDTVVGSDAGESTGLYGSGVVGGGGGGVAPGVPNLYAVEVLTENSTNRQEKAKLQVLYQY